MTDHYSDGTYLWWHLSAPSPELRQAISDRWFPPGGRAIDIGCGLGTEAAFLHRAGWHVVGIDLVAAALTGAAARNPGPSYLLADLSRLPLAPAAFDVALDRGCFHYLSPSDRSGYAGQVRRVLRPGGKLLLRASLRTAGERNDMDESVVRATFAGWTIERMERTQIPSDTRSMDMLLVRLTAA
jgi:SAM-dependent methyltransferase